MSTLAPMAKDRRVRLREVAKDTQQKIPAILFANRNTSPRDAYLVTPTNVPCLTSTQPYYPNLTTKVRVARADTFNAALSLEQTREKLGLTDTRLICVLNFANALKIGGGWINGAGAQEEQLCFRSTLSAALPPRFYPVGEVECIYSPSVYIFKQDESQQFARIPLEDPAMLPVVSVISMAATSGPAVVESDGVLKYQDKAQRTLMENKMRMILRVAAYNHHRTLILGALGCGAFGHPPAEVADCWKLVLQEQEFKGWFEVIGFAILDGREKNYEVFYPVLHGLEM